MGEGGYEKSLGVCVGVGWRGWYILEMPYIATSPVDFARISLTLCSTDRPILSQIALLLNSAIWCVYVSVCRLSVCLAVCVPVCVCVCVTVSLCVCVSVSVSLCLCLNACVSLALSVCVCLSRSLCLFVCLVACWLTGWLWLVCQLVS